MTKKVRNSKLIRGMLKNNTIRGISDRCIMFCRNNYIIQCLKEAKNILVTSGPLELCKSAGRFTMRTLRIMKNREEGSVRSLNNKDGYLAYDSYYEENRVYVGDLDVKMLAFYLPQYHTFPENDEWWGKGFTEWTNVKKGDARFEGHYQPRVPHKDIGYYCLDDIETLKAQAKLAKEHGIYGFCFYYYWFSGKRLMEKPVDLLLEHPEVELPFCMCWANENWTRTWDGQNKNILIAQDYSEEDDIRFMLDLKKYIDDPRYIRIQGKPLVIVYNPGQIPDCRKSFEQWRETAKQCGIGEILIWTCQTANNTGEKLGILDYVDGEVEFPPHNMWKEEYAVRGLDLKGKAAFIYNYQCLVDDVVNKLKNKDNYQVPIHHACTMAWDNAARRKNAWFTYYAFSQNSFYKWVRAIVERAREDLPEEERFVFINAWNEWGEGTYLEPDEKYGYANINTVSRALHEIPNDREITVLNEKSEQCENMPDGKIAVQIHMFYTETMYETIENLNYIPYPYDCYISTDTSEKKRLIEDTFGKKSTCNKLVVDVILNRGRDVAPLIVQMTPIIKDYKYICHIHSKKTATGDHGNEWRTYIFRHLFGSRAYMKALFELFENNNDIGIIMPETFPVLNLQAEWGGNREGVVELLKRLECRSDNLPELPQFPVGNMFWARTDAILPMFTHGLTQKDFPEEKGQVNATIAHQIERSWIYIAKDRSYSFRKVYNNFQSETKELPVKRLGIFVHYDKDNVVSEDDLRSLKELTSVTSKLIVVSNSELNQEQVEKVQAITENLIIRKNIGLDFGGWKQALLAEGRENISDYQELLLANNSGFAPVISLSEMFDEMAKRTVDFWGCTVFPYLNSGEYIHKKCIPEHLQSYFVIYRKPVLESDVFWKFWEEMPIYEKYIDVVANCETQFTEILSKAGFTYEPYVLESRYICKYLMNYSLPYEKPSTFLLLRNPFVKKKCYQHMDEDEKMYLEYLMKEMRE